MKNNGALFIGIFLTACGGASTIQDQASVQSDGLQPAPQNMAGDWQPSVFDHDRSEVIGVAQVALPIKYNKIFNRERELYGYDPRYLSSRPNFDADNLPWLYVQNNNQVAATGDTVLNVSAVTDLPTGKKLTDITYDNRFFRNRYSESNPCTRCDDLLLRLTKEGRWMQLSLYELGQQLGFKAPPPGGDDQSRWRARENIYFQNNGDIFIMLHHGIAHYRRKTNSWHGIQHQGIGRNHTMVGDTETPPYFLTSRWPEFDEIVVVHLVSDGDGLYRLEYFDVPHDFNISYDYSSNWVIKRGNYLHIAGMSQDPFDFGRQPYNTANVYLRLNLKTKELDTVFMGWTGNSQSAEPDDHNKPVILLDPKGHLHFISGAHNHKVWHSRSLLSVDDPAWNNNEAQWNAATPAASKFSATPQTPVTRVAANSPDEPGVSYVSDMNALTYTEAEIDSQGNIHLFVRNILAQGDSRKRVLAYIYGEQKGDGKILWENRDTIVEPSWTSYSNFKHLVTKDHKDNIFLLYTYEIQNFYDNEWFNTVTGDRELYSLSECESLSEAADCINVKDEHYFRWPDEPLTNLGSYGWAQEYVHGPTLLGGYKSGSVWRLMTTTQFISNMH